MKGIQFVVDDQGEKKAVLIDLQKNKDLWEDIYDSLVATERAKEPRESLDISNYRPKTTRRKRRGEVI